MSPNYPNPYDNNAACELSVNRAVVLSVQAFNTEDSYDKLWVRWSPVPFTGISYGSRYDGTNGPDGMSLNAGDSITFESDNSVARSGFYICGTVPSPPPPPPSFSWSCADKGAILDSATTFSINYGGGDAVTLTGCEGTVPTEIGMLTALSRFWIWTASTSNSFTGTLPTEIGLLTNLQSFHYGDQLPGTLPTELFRLTSLTALHGRYYLPTEIGWLTNMRSMSIWGGEQGPLPTELGRLTNLQSFTSSNNRFMGTIPTELGRLTQLTRIWLNGGTLLTGTIPTELAALTMLEELSLDFTWSLQSEEIPAEIRALTTLTRCTTKDSINQCA